MSQNPHHRQSTADEVAERLRRSQADLDASKIEIREGASMSTPPAGAKQTLITLEDDTVQAPPSPTDYHSTYISHKQEIDTWYDGQHTQRLGLSEYAKAIHSTDPWFVKVDAWMTPTGRSSSVSKNLDNNGTAVKTCPPTPPPRPDRVKYPGDLVLVPDRPFDELSDFETMPNGRYPCGHVDRKPPLPCCVQGLSREKKVMAIQRTVAAWKGKVERLIDEGKLSRRHKTWEGWTNMELRKKYQPTVGRARSTGVARDVVIRTEVRPQSERKRPDSVGDQSTQAPRQAYGYAPRPGFARGFARGFEPNPPAKVLQQPEDDGSRPSPVQHRNGLSDAKVNLSEPAEDDGPQAVVTTPFNVWNHKSIDGKLDRILSTSTVGVTEAVPQSTISARSGVAHLSSLQEMPTTAIQVEDGELQHLLWEVYQTDVPTLKGAAEDEQLLSDMTEESRADWERYCKFFASNSTDDEQTQAEALLASCWSDSGS